MAHPLETVALHPAPGVAIAAEVMAGDPPAYVYMHGMSSVRVGEKSEALLEHARQRGRGFARFDFRGHGESSGTVTDLTLTDLVADATAVLHRVGPSLLVGSSLGGLVAAWAATRNQDLVRGLTLLSPALGFLPAIASSARRGDPVRMQDSSGDELVFSERALADILNYDESTLPSMLSMPTLIVHGEFDESVPCQISQRFFEALPNPRKDFWLVRGGDHRLNQPIRKIYERMDALMG
ncbi:MAG: alpha/beta hydrolase [Planctomycetota bacterium]